MSNQPQVSLLKCESAQVVQESKGQFAATVGFLALLVVVAYVGRIQRVQRLRYWSVHFGGNYEILIQILAEVQTLWFEQKQMQSPL